MKIETLIKYFKVGDNVKISFPGGKNLKGNILDIDEESIFIHNSSSISGIEIKHVSCIEKMLSVDNENSNKEIDVELAKHSVIQNQFTKGTDEKQNTIVKEVKPQPTKELSISYSAKVNNTIFIPFEIDDIPWKEDGLPEEYLFKGRDELINKLIKHYKSLDRRKTYMLYGLTRTGKSSILKYFDRKILNEKIKVDKEYKLLPLMWDLSTASNYSDAKEMWTYLIGEATTKRIKRFSNDDTITLPDSDLLHRTDYRFKHLKELISFLKINDYFPIFLIDEFTYYENLVKSKKVDSAFLHTFRQLAYNNQACFVYAGTYNLKFLLKNPEYALSGQLVNTIEEPVAQIEEKYAIELINVFDKVKFEDDTVKQILTLSNRIPYFIQIICKNVAYYCHEIKSNTVTKEILDCVIKILVGDIPTDGETMVRRISSGTFDSNQFNPVDATGSTLLSTIAYLEKDKITATGIKYNEIMSFWEQHRIPRGVVVLNEKIETLKEQGILQTIPEKDGVPRYKIGVDLFRRWLYNEKPDIELELAKLQNESYV